MYLFVKDPKKRKIRLLNEAEHTLIDAELALEAAKAYATAAKARVARLKSELCQHAPTKATETVTTGDITQGSLSYVGATVSGDSIQPSGTIPLNRYYRRNAQSS